MQFIVRCCYIRCCLLLLIKSLSSFGLVKLLMLLRTRNLLSFLLFCAIYPIYVHLAFPFRSGQCSHFMCNYRCVHLSNYISVRFLELHVCCLVWALWLCLFVVISSSVSNNALLHLNGTKENSCISFVRSWARGMMIFKS